jgi:hypothetical protein
VIRIRRRVLLHDARHLVSGPAAAAGAWSGCKVPTNAIAAARDAMALRRMEPREGEGRGEQRGWASLARRRLFPASKLQSGFEQAPPAPAAPVGLHTGRRRRLRLGWAVLYALAQNLEIKQGRVRARQNGSVQRDTPTQTRVARQLSSQTGNRQGSAPLPAEPPARAHVGSDSGVGPVRHLAPRPALCPSSSPLPRSTTGSV